MIATIVRVLLGLLFVAAGIVAFVMSPPPTPGLAGQFNAAFHDSHWSRFVASAQIVAGAFLLANRFVPVALIVIAGFLYNSFAFHLTMLPMGLPAPIIATILWLIVAMKYQSTFAPLFEPKVSV